MDIEEFRKYGREMIDYICDYTQNVEKRDVVPAVEPGYLKKLLPENAPLKGEPFENIMNDVEDKIMKGIVHWNHPNFFAYFPSGNSFPSILGDMLSSAMSVIGFSWASSPAATELETLVLDWYAKALDLPTFFLANHPDSQGGGAIQGSASEAVLVSLISARARAINQLKGTNLQTHDSIYLSQLVAYASKDAHSCVEKAAKMAIVKLRILDTDSNGVFRGETLKSAIERDVEAGLTPFFVVATLGTTGACAFDNIQEIGEVCKKYSSVWFHIDAAYAGNSFILPELRHFKKGVEYADSFCTNPNKLLLTNFDASALWVKDVMSLQSALTVNPLYLQHEHSSSIDYRHYGIPLSRRFRSLKLWFVFRTYGISGLQKYIRNHITLAKRFEQHVIDDDHFEVMNNVQLGLVCFRLKQADRMNQDLLTRINNTGKMHMIPSMVKGKYIIRFCVTYEHATEKHIDDAWKEIKQIAEEILEEENPKKITKKPPKITRTISTKFNFIRSVSREVYERQSSIPNLTDGCTPIIVPDTDYILASLHRETKRNQIKAQANVDSNDEVELSDDSVASN